MMTDAASPLDALRHLVELKDGPRDDNYRVSKEAAWNAARHALDAASPVAATPEPTKTTICIHGNSPATCNDFRVIDVPAAPTNEPTPAQIALTDFGRELASLIPSQSEDARRAYAHVLELLECRAAVLAGPVAVASPEPEPKDITE